ncbi:hypothetical protein C8R46DRAFT_1097153 [Mycena filopes]|nr:hypothetical protein C8R46DRAFT_1097153 [Mycena filopes]
MARTIGQRDGGASNGSKLIYDDMRGALKIFLEGVLRDAALYTEHGYRLVFFFFQAQV